MNQIDINLQKDTKATKKKLGNHMVKLFSESGESRGYYSKKNRINDLTGREWKYWTRSVINRPYPINLQHKLRSEHGGQKPPELCRDLIDIFSKEGQIVLDPFAGVGGTLLGATLCDRSAVGIEIVQRYVDIYREVCRREGLEEQTMICGDSLDKLDAYVDQGRQFDFVLTDVPYWNMDSVKRSKGKFKRVGEKAIEVRKTKLRAFPAAQFKSKQEWLEQLSLIFEKTAMVLKKNHYLAVFIGDMYNKKQYHFLSADLADLLRSLKLTMKANIVWYDVSKSLHIYGYLYEYIPSMIHQNVLIFRNERE